MEIIAFLGPLGIALIVIAILIISGLKVIQEYERGVLFRLGKLAGARGPGLTYVIPGVERLVKIDLRVITMDVPAQEAITRDNVTVRVNAVVYFRVMNPQDAVVKVLDYIRATSMIAQTTLRSVLGQSLMDELLSQRDKINQELQRIIDEQTEPSSRCATSSCRSRCSAPWPVRPRPSGRSGRRSFTPRASTRRPPASPPRRRSSAASRSHSSYAICRR